VALTSGTSLADSSDDVFWREAFDRAQVSQFVDALVYDDDYVYIGGNFLYLDGEKFNYVARWDGQSWSKLGSGVGTDFMGLVHFMFLHEGLLYAGGMFDQVGPFRASNFAVWNGTDWFPVGEGTDNPVRGISVTDDGKMYLGGEFTTAGGNPSMASAMWDGQNYHDLQGGMDKKSRIVAVEAAGNDVYFGGYIATAGGKPVQNIAKWDGTEWHDLGGGTNGTVTVIEEVKGNLYVGGTFTHAGGVNSPGIAVWDGIRWRGLGRGLRGLYTPAVRSIIVEQGEVYVAGFFRNAGATELNNLAVWNGKAWNPMGSGSDGIVKWMVRRDNELLVVGNFQTIGSISNSPYFARWTRPPAHVVEFNSFVAKANSEKIDLAWDVSSYGELSGFNLYRRAVATDVSVQINTDLIALDVNQWSDPDVSTGVDYEYTLGVVRGDDSEALSAPERVRLSPAAFSLRQNFPNPFNPQTTIAFTLPSSGAVELSVYNLAGQLIRRLIAGEQITAGEHERQWDGRDESGNPAATGVYLYRLSAGEQTTARKMVLLK